MLETIIVILVVLWLLGAFGHRVSPRIPEMGSVVHALIVIALILFVLRVLGAI